MAGNWQLMILIFVILTVSFCTGNNFSSPVTTTDHREDMKSTAGITAKSQSERSTTVTKPGSEIIYTTSVTWDNVTQGYNDTLVGVGGVGTPLWVRIMDILQAMCSLIGFISNLVTLVTLMRSNIGLGPAVSLLLRHQSTVDMVICLLASLLIIPPPMWTCGIDKLDEFLCHAWHSQAFYWQW